MEGNCPFSKDTDQEMGETLDSYASERGMLYGIHKELRN